MKTVVLLSGGLDSTVLLWDMATRLGPDQVAALSVNYGQRHSVELQAAACVEARYAVDFGVKLTRASIDLSVLRSVFGGSSQTDPAIQVPHGHYQAENMKVTVVPNRNMTLLAVAAGFAISLGAESVTIAAHAGDHAIYPDCRAEFMDAMRGALALCHFTPVKLVAPFVGMTKAEIASHGHKLCAPMGLTWSCYEGGDVHCGRCGTCVERKEAFRLANVDDPTIYAIPTAGESLR